MKGLLILTTIALVSAALVTWSSKPQPLEDRLIYLQVKHVLPQYAADLHHETVAMQSQFVDFSYDQVLVAKAHLALIRYPEMTRNVFEFYGSAPGFQEVLRIYGEHVVPPIYYFLSNDVFLTSHLLNQVGAYGQSLLDRLTWPWAEKQDKVEAVISKQDAWADLSPEDRGWYAIAFIKNDGHNFLGQFATSEDGQVHWIQSERFLEFTNALFLGGIRNLETRHRLGEPIGLKEVGLATIDIAVAVSAIKLMRLGRTTTVSSKPMGLTQRSQTLAPPLFRTGALSARLAKYGVPAAGVYIAIRHPSILNSLFLKVAEMAGLPVFLVQGIGWFLVLLPVLLVLRFIMHPLGVALVLVGRGLKIFAKIFNNSNVPQETSVRA